MWADHLAELVVVAVDLGVCAGLAGTAADRHVDTVRYLRRHLLRPLPTLERQPDLVDPLRDARERRREGGDWG